MEHVKYENISRDGRKAKAKDSNAMRIVFIHEGKSGMSKKTISGNKIAIDSSAMGISASIYLSIHPHILMFSYPRIIHHIISYQSPITHSPHLKHRSDPPISQKPLFRPHPTNQLQSFNPSPPPLDLPPPKANPSPPLPQPRPHPQTSSPQLPESP